VVVVVVAVMVAVVVVVAVMVVVVAVVVVVVAVVVVVVLAVMVAVVVVVVVAVMVVVVAVVVVVVVAVVVVVVLAVMVAVVVVVVVIVAAAIVVKCYVWSIALFGAETSKFRQVDRNTWEVLKCGVGAGWTDGVRSGEVLHRVEDERNIIHTVNTRKANWSGNILRTNCHLSFLQVKSLHFMGETEKIHENTHSA
jgi:hypothetical protein